MLHNFAKFHSIIDLFENKTNGIFSLLDDQCKKRTNSTHNLMNCFGNSLRKEVFDISKTESSVFIIRHFAKHVSYSTVKLKFIPKNHRICTTQ